jgi:hypothetical protein
MAKQEFTIAYLQEIEKNHKEYFESKELSIMDCVVVKGDKLVSVHVINKELPFDICDEIETMFWVD